MTYNIKNKIIKKLNFLKKTCILKTFYYIS